MFEPTIKYRRVNDPPKKSIQPLDDTPSAKSNESADKPIINEKVADTNTAENKQQVEPDTKTTEETQKDTEVKEEAKKMDTLASFSFEEEEEDSKIEVDPNDKERIIVTLSTGKKYSADRYCPHAGADLSYHGRVAEDDYPPEIGPVLMCPIHYWEFALEKEGRGGGGWATINACPVDVAEKCAASSEKKKLEW